MEKGAWRLCEGEDRLYKHKQSPMFATASNSTSACAGVTLAGAQGTFHSCLTPPRPSHPSTSPLPPLSGPCRLPVADFFCTECFEVMVGGCRLGNHPRREEIISATFSYWDAKVGPLRCLQHLEITPQCQLARLNCYARALQPSNPLT